MLRFSCPPSRGFIARGCAQLAPTSSTASSSSSPSVNCPSFLRSPSWNNAADDDQSKNYSNNNNNTVLYHRPSNHVMPLCPTLATHPRFFTTSTTPSSPAASNAFTNNTINSENSIAQNAALNLWFNDKLVRHVVNELRDSNNNEILVATFTALHEKVGQNYSSLLEDMKASNVNTSNGSFLDNLEGTILDIAVLEKMVNWESKNNNTNNTTTSTDPLLFGTLCFLNAFAKATPQLIVPSVDVGSLSHTIPYIDFDMLCSRLSIDFYFKHVSQPFSELMNLTIKRYNQFDERRKLAVTITERIKQRHFEIKQHHVRRANEKQQEGKTSIDSAQVVAQAKLLESADCHFSCSWAGLATCSKRYTDVPTALRHQFVRDDYRDTTPSSDITPCRFDIVNIVTGPSGSGKTISSLVARPNRSIIIPVYNILIHVGIDCCKLGDVSCERYCREREATRELLRGILCSLVLASSDEISKLLPSDEDMWKKFREIIESSSLRSSANTDVHVRIVVDEIGKTPSFLRGLCSVWGQIQDTLADIFLLSSNRLELVVVGSGTECFELSPPGSFPVVYQILVVSRHKAMFKQLFSHFQEKVVTESRLVKELYKILVTDAALQTDPIVKAIIRMSSNLRCGAIILSFIETTALNFQTLLKGNREDPTVWTFDQVRSVIAGWCPLIATAFASKSDLSIFAGNVNELKYILGRAIGFALNRDHHLVQLPQSLDKNDIAKIVDATREENFRNESNKIRQDYVVRFGLLYDTARRRDKIFCGEENYDVIDGVDVDDNHTSEVHYYYFARKGQPRFLIDDAFVTMFLFLTQSTSTCSFFNPHPSKDLLFEEANWDFARVAAQFGRRASVDEIVASLDKKHFTPPHLLYGLGVKKVYSMHIESRLEEKTIKEKAMFPQELRTGAIFWRKAIQMEDAACVLLNGDNAEGADMIVLSRNRIVLTQYKNSSTTMNRDFVQKSVSNMKGRQLLKFLCSIVVDPNHTDKQIEVFYVIAGREANSFTADAFEGMSKEMTAPGSDPFKTQYNIRETLHGTHAGMTCAFYPILQFALPRRNDAQPFELSMIRSSIDADGAKLETSEVHFSKSSSGTRH